MTSKPGSRNGQVKAKKGTVSKPILGLHPNSDHPPVWVQLTNLDDAEKNDFIGPFECGPAAKAHVMVYGPGLCFIVQREEAPPEGHFMTPQSHKEYVYAQQRHYQRMLAEQAQQAAIAVSPEEAVSGDIPESAISADTAISEDPAISGNPGYTGSSEEGGERPI